MVKNKQLIVNGNTGDCMRASLTTILGVPNNKELPNFTEKTDRGTHNGGWPKWCKILAEMGLDLIYEDKKCWRSGYWMASVPSKNFKGAYHSIVMRGCEVFHDPSTKKRYRTGRSMLGNSLVRGGYYLEVTNVSLLPKLEEFRKKYGNNN